MPSNLQVAEVDWLACDLIEQVPGKVSGRPIVKGTRILPDALLHGYQSGDSIQDLQEGFPALTLDQIRRLLEFALSRPVPETR